MLSVPNMKANPFSLLQTHKSNRWTITRKKKTLKPYSLTLKWERELLDQREIEKALEADSRVWSCEAAKLLVWKEAGVAGSSAAARQAQHSGALGRQHGSAGFPARN